MRFLLVLVYGLMIGIGLIAMYTLLSAGSPDSLLRPFIPNPKYDFYIAFASSFCIFFLGFIIFFTRDREGFKQLIEINAQKIRSMQKEGSSREEIAASILEAMGIAKGYRYNLARKKLIIFLSDFK